MAGAHGIDFHQHLWPEAFVRALLARERPPRLVRAAGDVRLVVDHEPDSVVDLRAHDLAARLGRLERDGVKAAVISISSPVGVEALPADEALALVQEYHSGMEAAVSAAGGRLRALAAVPLAAGDDAVAEVAPMLDRGWPGASLPADALATPDGLDRCRAVLDALAERDAVLFVHPGPAPWHATRADPSLPRWWSNCAQYTGAMLAAFYTWRARPDLRPAGLRAVFAVMAGGAPFLEERYAAFHGASHPVDPHVFFDTASFGPRALDLAMSTYGAERLVLGTDVPVIDGAGVRAAIGALGEPVRRLVAEHTPAALLAPRAPATRLEVA
jgi:hypothetical protein